MRGKKPEKGRVLMGIGLVLMAAALVLALRLIKEEHDAGVSAQNVLLQMAASAEPTAAASAQPIETPSAQPSPEISVSPSATPLFTPQPEPTTAAVTAVPKPPRRALFEINPEMEMPITIIDSNEYIGVLDFPVLGISLPVMSDWSYPQLKLSPCRFNGTVRGEDLVLMAHNYKSHFGYISQLKIGDAVIFTDMDGNVTEYKVVGTDVLAPTEVETRIAGDFDLTLVTCTYGGKSRVTVYCDKN